MKVNGILGTVELASQHFELVVGPLNQLKTNQLNFPFTHPMMDIGNSQLDYEHLKLQHPYLKVLPDASNRLDDVKIIIGQDAYHLIRHSEYKSGESSQPWVVRTDLG